MKLSVITSYTDRLDALRNYVRFIEGADRSRIEFIIISWGDYNFEIAKICDQNDIKLLVHENTGVFQTAICHNRAVTLSKGEWILKQDIDCFPHIGFYNELADYVDDMVEPYLVIGAKYLKAMDIDPKKITKQYIKSLPIGARENTWDTGNEYVVKRSDYIRIGGENENFKGYYGEDYEFLYRLEKLFTPEMNITSRQPDIVKAYIRQNIVQRNNLHISNKKSWCFLHRYHDRKKTSDGYRDYIQDNRKLLAEAVTK